VFFLHKKKRKKKKAFSLPCLSIFYSQLFLSPSSSLFQDIPGLVPLLPPPTVPSGDPFLTAQNPLYQRQQQCEFSTLPVHFLSFDFHHVVEWRQITKISNFNMIANG
jgi:hypothetical protein